MHGACGNMLQNWMCSAMMDEQQQSPELLPAKSWLLLIKDHHLISARMSRGLSRIITESASSISTGVVTIDVKSRSRANCVRDDGFIASVSHSALMTSVKIFATKMPVPHQHVSINMLLLTYQQQ